MKGLIYTQTTPPNRNSNSARGWGKEKERMHAVLEEISINHLMSEVKIGKITVITIFDCMRLEELCTSTSIKSFR